MSNRKSLSDDQYLRIDELRLIECDLQNRLTELIRSSGHDIRYNTRSLEKSQDRFREAFMWAAAGIANEGLAYRE